MQTNDERSRVENLTDGAAVPPGLEALAKEYEKRGLITLAAELRVSASHVVIAHSLSELLRRLFEQELKRDTTRDCPGCGE